MVIDVDLGERVKINSINFTGNDLFKSKKLKKQMKNTKSKFIGKIFEKSQNILKMIMKKI